MGRFVNVALVLVFVAAVARLRLTSDTYNRPIWRRPNTNAPEPSSTGVVLIPDRRRAAAEAIWASIGAAGLTLLIGTSALSGDAPGWFWSSAIGIAWAALVFAAASEITTYRALRRMDTLATITPSAVTHHRTGKVIPVVDLAEVTVAKSISGAESLRFRSVSDAAIRVNLHHSAILYADGPGKPELRSIVSALPREGRIVG